MRALTGFAHAGYAALHVRDMLSHGDSDPLQAIPRLVLQRHDVRPWLGGVRSERQHVHKHKAVP